MHVADGEDYYENILRSCKPKDEVQCRILFLENKIEELEKENADMRRQLGIKKMIYNGHLGTMCEED